MCDFCNLNKEVFYGLKGSDKKIGSTIFIQKDNFDNVVYLYSVGEHMGKFEVQYCPICGSYIK